MKTFQRSQTPWISTVCGVHWLLSKQVLKLFLETEYLSRVMTEGLSLVTYHNAFCHCDCSKKVETLSKILWIIIGSCLIFIMINIYPAILLCWKNCGFWEFKKINIYLAFTLYKSPCPDRCHREYEDGWEASRGSESCRRYKHIHQEI